MKKSTEKGAFAPVDLAQRYTITEAQSYLRISHATIYQEIGAGRIRVIKLGKRTFVPGSEIAQLSRLEEDDAPQEPVAPAKSEPSLTTSCRLLDSRIHQALMRDIARQQVLFDVLEKLDVKLEHLTRLIERLVANAPRREIRATEASTIQPQFMRSKDVMARVGLACARCTDGWPRAPSRSPERLGALPIGSLPR